mgnify:CR=1 FL=1
MSKLGSSDNPLKVAIVGAGPSGFYAADALINSDLKVEVNLIEKLCAPYGLVRTGVAPDHPLIKKSIGLKNIPPPIPTIPDTKPKPLPIAIAIGKGIFLKFSSLSS